MASPARQLGYSSVSPEVNRVKELLRDYAKLRQSLPIPASAPFSTGADDQEQLLHAVRSDQSLPKDRQDRHTRLVELREKIRALSATSIFHHRSPRLVFCILQRLALVKGRLSRLTVDDVSHWVDIAKETTGIDECSCTMVTGTEEDLAATLADGAVGLADEAIGLADSFNHLKENYKHVKAEKKRLETQVKGLETENTDLKAENRDLKTEKENLKTREKCLKTGEKRLESCRQSLDSRKQDVESWAQDVEAQLEKSKKDRDADLEVYDDQLKECVDKYETQLKEFQINHAIEIQRRDDQFAAYKSQLQTSQDGHAAELRKRDTEFKEYKSRSTETAQLDLAKVQATLARIEAKSVQDRNEFDKRLEEHRQASKSLRDRLATARNRESKLTNENTRLQQEQNAQAEIVKQMKEDTNEQAAKITRLGEDLIARKKTVDDQGTQNEALVNKVTGLEKEQGALTERLDEAHRNADKQGNEVIRLTEELETRTEASADKVTRLTNELEAQKDASANEVIRLTKALEAQKEASTNEVTRLTKALEAQKEASTNEVTRLTKALEAANVANEANTRQLSRETNLVAEKTKSEKALQDQNARLTASLTVRDKKVTELTGDLDKRKTDSDTLQSQLSTVKAALKNRENNFTTLEIEFSDTKVTLKKRENDFTKLQSDLSDTKVALKKRESDFTTFETDLSTAKAALNNREYDFTILETDLSDTKATLQKRESKIAALNTNLSTTIAALKNRENDFTKLQSDLSDTKAALKKREGKVAALNTNLSTTIAALKACKRKASIKNAALCRLVFVITGVYRNFRKTQADSRRRLVETTFQLLEAATNWNCSALLDSPLLYCYKDLPSNLRLDSPQLISFRPFFRLLESLRRQRQDMPRQPHLDNVVAAGSKYQDSLCRLDASLGQYTTTAAASCFSPIPDPHRCYEIINLVILASSKGNEFFNTLYPHLFSMIDFSESCALCTEDQLKDQLFSAESANQKLQTDLESVMSERDELQNDVSILKPCNRKLQADLEGVTSDRDKLQKDVSRLESCNRKLQTDLKSVMSERDKLQNDVSILKPCNQNLQADLSDVQSKLLSAGSDNKELQEDVSRLESRNQNLQADLLDVQSKLVSASSDNKELQTRLSDVQTRLSDVQSKLVSAKSRNEELQTDLSGVQSNERRLRCELTRTQTYLQWISIDYKYKLPRLRLALYASLDLADKNDFTSALESYETNERGPRPSQSWTIKLPWDRASLGLPQVEPSDAVFRTAVRLYAIRSYSSQKDRKLQLSLLQSLEGLPIDNRWAAILAAAVQPLFEALALNPTSSPIEISIGLLLFNVIHLAALQKDAIFATLMPRLQNVDSGIRHLFSCITGSRPADADSSTFFRISESGKHAIAAYPDQAYVWLVHLEQRRLCTIPKEFMNFESSNSIFVQDSYSKQLIPLFPGTDANIQWAFRNATFLYSPKPEHQ